jgi:hypothetical protein
VDLAARSNPALRRSSPRRRSICVGVIALLIGTALGCGSRAHKPIAPAPTSNVALGTCADPGRDGVVGQRPRLDRADRDLDGDRVEEAVVADRGLCTDEGNCYWNVYAAPAGSGSEGGTCWRYVGTIPARVIDRLRQRGDDGFHDLRGWWRLAGGGRMLLQEYRYRHGAYRIVETMVCQQQDDDRLRCASDQPKGP